MIDIQTARQLARLSGIAFTDSELRGIAADMADIISLMDEIRAFAPDECGARMQNGMSTSDLRGDICEKSDLSAAIVPEDSGISVPRVV